MLENSFCLAVPFPSVNGTNCPGGYALYQCILKDDGGNTKALIDEQFLSYLMS